VQAFLTGSRAAPDLDDRVLATVLFTDIVGSTERAATLGDQRWRMVLGEHEQAARIEVERYRGRLVKLTGDGILATFDGPTRATRCAVALMEAVRDLGIELRAGLHIGEVEMLDNEVAGIAVHIAQRVMGEAGPGEVLVSGAVPPLVAGSGIDFDDLGTRKLKGVPGEWKVFSVRG
jgi:class 3 adenylate cyclase